MIREGRGDHTSFFTILCRYDVIERRSIFFSIKNQISLHYLHKLWDFVNVRTPGKEVSIVNINMYYIQRRSGIPCKILRGIGKDSDYYIGRPEAEMASQWCAVFADDEWRFVHVDWLMAAAKDHNENIQNPEVNV